MTYLATALRTRVVHVRDGYDCYIGRAMPGKESSAFANPFRIGPDGTRADVIQLYKTWLVQRLADEPELRLQLETLRGRRLGCWCKPDDCHGDVLVWLLGEGPEPFAQLQQSLF